MKKKSDKNVENEKALSGMGMDTSSFKTAKSKGFVKSEIKEGEKKDSKKSNGKASQKGKGDSKENNKISLDGVPEFMVEDLKDIVLSSSRSVLIEKDTHELIRRVKALTGVPIRHVVTAALLYYVRNHKKELEQLSKKESPRWKL